MRAGAALFLCALHGAAFAGAFDVNPVRVELSAAARSTVLTVRNSGADAVVVQLTVMAWSQADGADQLSETTDVIVSPPIATIAAGAEQVVRIGLRRAPDTEQELSYRLFVEEVPPPLAAGFQGLRVALRVGLPVFVQPRKGGAKPALAWDARLHGEETLSIRAQNAGSGHVRISELNVLLPGEREALASQAMLAYVLPGQSREWLLKVPRARVKQADRLRLRISTDAGSLESEIGVAGP